MQTPKLPEPKILSPNQTLESVFGAVPPLETPRAIARLSKSHAVYERAKNFLQIRKFQNSANIEPEEAGRVAAEAVSAVRAKRKRASPKKRRK